jgi:hypothetical protein
VPAVLKSSAPLQPDHFALLDDAQTIIQEEIAYLRGRPDVNGQPITTRRAIAIVAETYGIGPSIVQRLWWGIQNNVSQQRYLWMKLHRVIEGRRRVTELELAAQAERERTAEHEAELKGALRTWGLYSGVVAEISQALLGLGPWPRPVGATTAPTDGALGTTG